MSFEAVNMKQKKIVKVLRNNFKCWVCTNKVDLYCGVMRSATIKIKTFGAIEPDGIKKEIFEKDGKVCKEMADSILESIVSNFDTKQQTP